MTTLSPQASQAQTAMLERLARKLAKQLGDAGYCNYDAVFEFLLPALRELLLAVQERDARVAEGFKGQGFSGHDETGWWDVRDRIVEAIKAQTYADLFPSTPTEEE